MFLLFSIFISNIMNYWRNRSVLNISIPMHQSHLTTNPGSTQYLASEKSKMKHFKTVYQFTQNHPARIFCLCLIKATTFCIFINLAGQDFYLSFGEDTSILLKRIYMRCTKKLIKIGRIFSKISMVFCIYLKFSLRIISALPYGEWHY